MTHQNVSYVAAFRSYTWNSTVVELAARFFASCPGARHVVLADETRGCLGISEYEVISHTENTTELGLLVYPKGSSLWYNVDYGAYILLSALPGYEYYLLSESDLAVNVDLRPMIYAAKSEKIDAIIHGVQPSTSDWFWHQNGTAVFEPSWRSLLFFMLFSRRAVEALATARRNLGQQFLAGGIDTWPFCEPFVPSILKSLEMRFEEVSRFANTEHLNFRPRISIDDSRANVPGSLVHSLVAKEDFIKLLISEADSRDWFNRSSHLRKELDKLAPELYLKLLVARFEHALDYAGRFKFLREMASKGFTMYVLDDLAYCKPSLTSSVSRWSKSPDPCKDAAGANGHIHHSDYGFHTEKEDAPWWMTDLCSEFVIDKIEITNRPNLEDRFSRFVIESSRCGEAWTARYFKIDAERVSSDDSSPFSVHLADPFVGRFVRIKLIGKGILHLKRIRVFGRSIVVPATDPESSG